MKPTKKIIYITGVVLFLALSSFRSFAGDTPNPCNDPLGPPDGCCDADGNYIPDDPACPIDGGVVALLAAGVGYGLKRARDSKKAKAVSE